MDSCISHGEFVLANNVLREYNEIKEGKKFLNFSGIHYMKTMETYCASRKKTTENENSSVRKTNQNRLMILSYCKIKNFQMISLK